MIKIKRVYEAAAPDDGDRFLVDRLWPRGIKKEMLKMTAWLKDAAPSNELRQWYHHDPERWDEFRRRYFEELRQNPDAWLPLTEAARAGTITLLYSAQHLEQNNAAALAEFLRNKPRKRSKR
ncbi:MAG TPA: DUF488 domain-containing protein [Terracidiphilus sp.]|nr:DUF488 domain-containing protein [Terracidiphilus sp.]